MAAMGWQIPRGHGFGGGVMALLGFAPDAPIMEPGALLDCANLVPRSPGMRPAKRLVSAGVDALPATPKGAFMSVSLSSTRAIYAGTKTKLYKLVGANWSDVSGGSTFTLSDDDRWSFAQFGDSVLASAKADDMQIATSTNFSAIGSAPKARILVSLKGFVMAFDTEDNIYGNQTDRWWCCAYLDASDWTPDVATMCTTGRLVESDGAIVAAAVLEDVIVAYKRGSTYLGRFVGPAEVWNWMLVDAGLGCVGPEAVCSSGAAHYFLGYDDICMFDGMRVQSIARGVVRRWYKSQRDPIEIVRAQAYWDKDAQVAWFHFMCQDGQQRSLVYEPSTGRWGRAQYPVVVPLRFAAPSITYNGGSPLFQTYDDDLGYPYDSSFWILDEEVMAAFDANNELRVFAGNPLPSSFTTGDYGDENQHTWCDRLTLRLQGEPITSTATGYVKDDAGVTAQSAQTAIRDDGAFDVRQRGRWHRFKVDSTGDYALLDIGPRLKQAGHR